MNFIFRNRTIFWDVSKWNRGQKKWDGGSIYIYIYIYQSKQEIDPCLFILQDCTKIISKPKHDIKLKTL